MSRKRYPDGKISMVLLNHSIRAAVCVAVSSVVSTVQAGTDRTVRSVRTHGSIFSHLPSGIKPNASQPTVATSIVVDTTLNPLNSGAIAPSNSVYTIGANYGAIAGNNEFFSFSTFNLGTADTANFTGPGNISNIVARVTGNTSSQINGTVGASASLWFINPAGVSLGAGATLNVPAGLAIGAADYINFADNSHWFGIPSQGTTQALPTVAPSNFGFISGSAPAAPTLGDQTTGAYPISITSNGNVILQNVLVDAGGNPFTVTGGSIDLENSSITTASDTLRSGAINIDSGGLISVNGTTLNSSTITDFPAGNITIVGSGVLVGANSLLDASGYGNEGSPPGGSASVLIQATGTSVDASPSTILNHATTGVVRIVDSTIYAKDSGGTDNIGTAGLEGGPGGITIGAYVSDDTTPNALHVTDDVVISHSTIANDVSAYGSNTLPIVVNAVKGVWIENSSTLSSTSTANAYANNRIYVGAGSSGITVDNSTLTASSATTITVFDEPEPPASGAGSVTLNANGGPITVSNNANITASASGVYNAGDVSLQTSAVAGSSLESVSISVLNSTLTSSYQSTNDGVTAYAGQIKVSSAGNVAFLNGTLQSLALDGAAGPGQISVTGAGSLTVQGGSISTKVEVASPGTPYYPETQTGSITLNANTIGLTGTQVDASTSGGLDSGAINIVANQVSIIGSGITASTTAAGSAGVIEIQATGADQNGPALSITGGSMISSDATAGTNSANAGTVTLTAMQGSVVVGLGSDSTPTSISSSAGLNAGQAGQISITGQRVALSNAQLLTTVATSSTVGTDGTTALLPASVIVGGTTANSVSMSNSLIDARTSGAVDAGSVNITGGTVSITGGQTPLPFGTSSGNLTLNSNTAIFSGTSGTGSAGAITISSPGLISVSDATVSAEAVGSSGTTAHAGAITIQGAGVLVADQSIVTADYNNAGGNPGGAGSITIQASGTGIEDMPQTNLTSATSGVVRVVDSLISSQNVGGVDGATGDRGTILIGANLQAGSPSPQGTLATDDVVIAGSIITNNVSASGSSGDLVINGLKGVWIENSPVGFALRTTPGDSRTAPTQSLISSIADNSAASVGEIHIGGGVEGVTINQAIVDADDFISGSNTPGNAPTAASNITVISTGGTISLSDAFISAQSTGINNAGDVSLQTVAAAGVSAAQAATANVITLSNSQLNSSAFAASGSPPSVGNAGAITIESAGNLQMTTGSFASSNAGVGSNQAGTVQLSANGSLTLDDAQANASIAAGNSSTAPSNITLSATGPISITDDSIVSSATNGAAPGGNISITTPSSITISGPSNNGSIAGNTTFISSETEGGSGQAGSITITGGSIHMTGGVIDASTLSVGAANNILLTATLPDSAAGAALVIDGGASILSAAEAGQSHAAIAGSIQLTADQGTIQVLSLPHYPSIISTSAGAQAGTAGSISLTANSILIDGADITTTVAASAPIPGSVGASIRLTAANSLSAEGSTLDASTSGALAGGDVIVTGSAVNLVGSTAAASSSGAGVAGTIGITANGADPLGGSALQITGGSQISSDASSGTNGAKAGKVTLTANQGSVQIGLLDDSAPTAISTSAGVNAGAAGAITVNGTGITLGDANLTTTAAGTEASLGTATAGSITLAANNGTGPLNIANSALNATTSGAQDAGKIELLGSQIGISNTNLASGTSSAAAAGDIDVTGQTVSIIGSVAGNSITVSTTGLGKAGDINIMANGVDPAGGTALQIDRMNVQSKATGVMGGAIGSVGNAGNITIESNGSLSLGDLAASVAPTLIQSSADQYSGLAGTVTVQSAGKLTAQNTTVDTSVATSQNLNTGGTVLPSISLSAPGAVALTGSTLTAKTSGAIAARDIDITGQTVNIIGSSGGDSITVSTTGLGNAGDINIMASGADPAGGAALQIDRMNVSSTASGVTGQAPGSVGNAGTIAITARNGSVSFGDLTANVAPTLIQSSADQYSGLAGTVTVQSAGTLTAQNTTVDTSVATSQNLNTGGTVLPSISLSAPGAVALTGSTLTAKTSGAIAARDITINGSTVNMLGSSATASTSGTGDAGTIGITANGADPASGAALQITGGSQISSDASLGTNGAKAGTVTLTAKNGSVQIGLPGDSAPTTISTSAGATAGAAGAIQVNGTGIALGDANLRTTAAGTEASLGTATAGSITLATNNDTGPLSIANSTLNATTSGAQQAGEIDLRGSQIGINDTNVASGTNSAAEAGDINITGQTVNIVGSTTGNSITVSTTGPGKAGNISITASGADPAGASALQIDRMTVSSTASGVTGQAAGSVGSAGTISIAAQNGSVRLGDLAANVAPTQIESSADQYSGLAGNVTISSMGTLAAQNTTVDTSVATSQNPEIFGTFLPGTISLTAPGAVSLMGSTFTARTSGSIVAGDIAISGSTVILATSTAAASTTGGGDAGKIGITANGPDTATGAALQITGGSQISSDASQGKNGANAGTVTLTASNGSVQIGSSIDTTQTLLSTSAGPAAGAAGGITVSGSGINLSGANLSTTAGGALPSATRGTISLSAGSGAGPVTIANSTLDAATSGVQQAGEVNILGSIIALNNASISSSTTGAGNAGNITIDAGAADPTGGSALQVAGSTVQSTATGSATTPAGNAGTITLAAAKGSVSLGGTLPSAAALIETSANVSAGQAGIIDITSAGNLSALATTVDTSVGTGVSNPGFTAGTITLSAPGSVTLSGSSLKATTSGVVAAGDITVDAGGPLSISAGGSSSAGLFSSSTSAASGAGGAGQINAAGSTITLDGVGVTATIAGGSALTPGANIVLNSSGGITAEGGTQINANTSGAAPGGSILFATPAAVLVGGAGTRVSSNTSGDGTGGDIDFGSVTTPISTLTVDAGAGVSVNAAGVGPAAGRAGAINIYASGAATLSGAGTTLSSVSSNDAVGGSVTLSASSLTMTDGAVITADTSSNGGAAAQPAGSAGSRGRGVRAPAPASRITGGSIAITTSGDVSLAGQGTSISAKASGTGSGGTVAIKAADLTLSDGAQIATTATGTGNSGTIAINLIPVAGTPPALSLTDSQILTSATASTGGNIDIAAQGNPLTLTNSVIAASSNGGNGSNGGNITITDVGRTILTGSGILAQANQGNGGAINLTLEPGALFIEDAQSLVSATSAAGNNGTVTINAPQTDLNSALAVPDVSVGRTPELTANACRRDRKRSTFVAEGRGGVKPSPDAYQSGHTGVAPSSASTAGADSAEVSTRSPQLAALAPVPGCG